MKAEQPLKPEPISKEELKEKRITAKAGRTNNLKAKVAGFVLSGKTLKAAAAECGVSENTVHQWKKKDPQFQEALRRHDMLAKMETETKHSIANSMVEQEVAIIAALRYRLQGLVDVCIDQLRDIIISDETPPKDKVSAIKEVFDRTGLIKDTNVTVRAQQAAHISPEQLSDAFSLLGISQDELKRSLPIEGTIISEDIEDIHQEGDTDGRQDIPSVD